MRGKTGPLKKFYIHNPHRNVCAVYTRKQYEYPGLFIMLPPITQRMAEKVGLDVRRL